MTLIEAARAALEALDDARHHMSAMGTTTEPQIAAQDALRTALTEAEAPTVPIDQIAVKAWKLRMVFFDEDGHPSASRQPEPAELREALAEAETPQPVAHLWQHSETGRTRIVMPDQIITADACWFVVGPLYLGASPPQPVAVPAGWDTVPTEPTDVMLLAGVGALYGASGGDLEATEREVRRVYKSMLAASPAAPAQVPLTAEQIKALLIVSGCVGTVQMTYSYGETAPTPDAQCD